MKRRMVFAAIPVLLLAGTTLLSAQPRPERGERMVKELELTKEQSAKMQDLRAAHMKAMADLQADVKKARIDLRGLMTTEEPDRDAIRAKMKEIADLRLEAADARVDHMFEVRSILTPEQRKIWKEHRREGMGRMGNRDARRPGRMGMHRDARPDGPGFRESDRLPW